MISGEDQVVDGVKNSPGTIRVDKEESRDKLIHFIIHPGKFNGRQKAHIVI
jgi:hypothetical protein